ncbi:hypothetical protein CLOM_g24045 [Closterium sp. NIES-68]|nr:hypothetical protein CLOM_g24045 [Closterium sp. NIES-68]GJP85316.1 hypothetical protein CLOP_g15423 [Closterium sp. NIES-67]
MAGPGPWRLIPHLAAVLCAVHVAAAQFEPAYEIAVRKADIPFIKCDVCKKMVEQLDTQVEREREKAEPKKLVEHEEDGECLSECKTIERACQQIIGDYDTDIAERIFNDEPSQSSLQRYLCHDLSKACSTKPPPVPEGREPGENWQKKDNSPPDYSKMAKEMNIPTSVMHDEAAIKDVKLPKGMGMPEEVFKRGQEKKAAEEARAAREEAEAAAGGKKKKTKKGSKKGSRDEAMGEMYSKAEEAAKGGREEIVKFVEKMTGKKVPETEPEAVGGYDEL